MTPDEIVRALPALGGAAGMLLVARWVYLIATSESGRLQERIRRIEIERDHLAREAARYRHLLITNGIEIPGDDNSGDEPSSPPPRRHIRRHDES